jgi:hypothetical protein
VTPSHAERRFHLSRKVCAGHHGSRVARLRERSGSVAKIIKGKNASRPWTARYWHEDRQRERSFTTRRQADEFIAKFEHDRRLNLFVDPRSAAETFREAAQRWIGTRRCHNTRSKYQGILDHHLTTLAGRKLREVANDRDGVQALTINHRQGKRRAFRTCKCRLQKSRRNSASLGGTARSRPGQARCPAGRRLARRLNALIGQRETGVQVRPVRAAPMRATRCSQAGHPARCGRRGPGRAGSLRRRARRP